MGRHAYVVCKKYSKQLIFHLFIPLSIFGPRSQLMALSSSIALPLARSALGIVRTTRRYGDMNHLNKNNDFTFVNLICAIHNQVGGLFSGSLLKINIASNSYDTINRPQIYLGFESTIHVGL